MQGSKVKRSIFIIVFLVLALMMPMNVAFAQTGQASVNGLTIALDTLRSTDTPQVIIDFMKQYHYNALRIYMGWCSSFWTGNVNAPMKTATQNYIDELCRLCAQNGFYMVCAVSMQVTPFRTVFPSEIQVGPNGEQNSQGNWVCPTGPNYQTFTKNLVRILTSIMGKYATPRISVDEIVFVTGGGKPTFYSQSMRNLYRQKTGKNIPVFTSTSGSYNSEQKQFIEFAKGTIRDLYLMVRDTAKAVNPNVMYQALVDTYWVYPKTSYDTEPWDFYGSSNLDEITYEWFYAIQNQNWNGITNGLKRIYDMNPSAKHYFIYGTSTMTTTTNMRKSVELTMAEHYDGVFLYEYAKSKSKPFDVSDIVSTSSPPTTPPSQPPAPSPITPPPVSTEPTLFEDSFESRSFSSWSGTKLSYGETMTVTNYAPHHGTYDACFTTNGNNGNENSYLFKNVDMQEVYARGYIRISSPQILTDDGDTLYLIRFSNATQPLARVGITRRLGINQWVLYARSGSGWTVPVYSATPLISASKWYCIELHWSAAKGLVEMFVDGIKVLQLTALKTTSYGNAKIVAFGIISATQVQNQFTTYADCFKLSGTYNGLEPTRTQTASSCQAPTMV